MKNKGAIITITSVKGGVGKTITTLLLALEFARHKKRVLIIDLDIYSGNIAFALNIQNEKNLYHLTSSKALKRYDDFKKEGYIYNLTKSIDIITSPSDPRDASKIGESALRKVISSMKFYYDVILIDTDHTMDFENIVAYDESEVILNMIKGTLFDIEKTKTFLNISKNIKRNNIKLLLNRSFYTSSLTVSKMEGILEKNIDYVFSNYIKNLEEAMLKNKTLNALAKVESKELKSIAASLLKEVEDEE